MDNDTSGPIGRHFAYFTEKQLTTYHILTEIVSDIVRNSFTASAQIKANTKHNFNICYPSSLVLIVLEEK